MENSHQAKRYPFILSKDRENREDRENKEFREISEALSTFIHKAQQLIFR